MRAIADPTNALARGIAAIRVEFQVPDGFPAEVLAQAEAAARRTPDAHTDRTGWNFITLDPAASTDLDQAFAIARNGSDILLHYAIADVGWFVDEDGAIAAEAWRRGGTLYLADGKAGLYPPALSEGAASLLPDGPRPSVLFTVRIAEDGGVGLDGVERAIIHNRAKLGYDQVREEDLPPEFRELSDRIAAAELRRGAARVDPPEQEVVALPNGRFDLRFRPRNIAEERNAALSLATNLAVADLLLANRGGLFRTMPEPHESAVRRLRHTARAFDIDWPKEETLQEFERRLDPSIANQAAMMGAVRRAGGGAAYEPFRDDVTPWHSAVADTYAHATAPLRRLADRYVVEAALAFANGRDVPAHVAAAFEKLPRVMARADARAAQIDRAVVDLAESVMLKDRVGESFDAVITDSDSRGDRVQLCRLPVVTRLEAGKVAPGDRIEVKLVAADPAERRLEFARLA